MSELLPCPFCGSHEVTRQSAMGEYWVLCETCLATSAMVHYEQGADALWNTRPASATAVEVTEGMAEEIARSFCNTTISVRSWSKLSETEQKDAVMEMKSALAAGLGNGRRDGQ